jgi:superkiller protein 8
VTRTQILSASGASSIKVHSTTSPDIPLAQTLSGAHKLGCHHIVTSRNERIAASAGFGGEVKIWSISESGEWVEEGKIEDGNKAGEIWAVALSEDGQFLASTTYDGRINVWDLVAGRKKIREYETKGSFGMCIDMSRDGRFTASGHENGGVYVFNNDTGRMLYSLPGKFIPLNLFICSLLMEIRFGEASTDGCFLTCWYSSRCCRRREGYCFVRCPTRRASCQSHRPLSMDLLGGLE